MNIGIIVYSKTGNTLLVAERIREELIQNGHMASIERFTTQTENQHKTSIKLSAAPDPNGFEAVIFGAPVQAFSLDPAMSLYIQQMGLAQQIPVLCFMTQHFKKSWLGGNRAMKQLIVLLHEKRIAAEPMGTVNWSNERREEQIVLIAKRCVETLREENK
jgi:flavodoxin